MMSQGTCTAYSAPSQTEKLSRLRAKTDRQIMDFIRSKLKMASDLATMAEEEFSEGNRVSAQQSIGHADRVLGEAQTLMLLINEQQRRALEWKFDQVAAALERVCRKGELVRPLFSVA